jgi:selenoprotein W-related protein
VATRSIYAGAFGRGHQMSVGTVEPIPAVPAAAAILMAVAMRQPRLEIEYCTRCRWLLRAAWTAQELLTTFQLRLGEVALVPGIGGVFEVRVDDEIIWSRKEQGFPELAELKRLVRDRIAPGMDLGHSDTP